MKKFIWVAAIALLLFLALGTGGVPSNNAWAQELPAVTKPADEKPADTKPADKKPAEGTSEEKPYGGQSLPLVTRPPCPEKTEPSGLTATDLKPLEEKLEGLGGRISLVETTLKVEVPPEWAGWHWSVYGTGKTAVFTGDASYAVPFGVGGFARWISRHQLGLELGTEVGAWATEGVKKDMTPFMISFPLHGVAAWEKWGLFTGPSFSVLQSPVKGEGAYALALWEGGGEFRHKGFLARLGLGYPMYSQLQRLTGLWVGANLGYYR